MLGFAEDINATFGMLELEAAMVLTSRGKLAQELGRLYVMKV
jgi:hypothetical protein